MLKLIETDQVVDLPRWGVLRDRPFTRKGNYLISLLKRKQYDTNSKKKPNSQLWPGGLSPPFDQQVTLSWKKSLSPHIRCGGVFTLAENTISLQEVSLPRLWLGGLSLPWWRTPSSTLAVTLKKGSLYLGDAFTCWCNNYGYLPKMSLYVWRNREWGVVFKKGQVGSIRGETEASLTCSTYPIKEECASPLWLVGQCGGVQWTTKSVTYLRFYFIV